MIWQHVCRQRQVETARQGLPIMKAAPDSEIAPSTVAASASPGGANCLTGVAIVRD
jgi:hypothetical protein